MSKRKQSKRYKQRAEARQQRREFRARYGPMIEACTYALGQVDPVGIADFEQYDVQAEAIVPLLDDCRSAVQVEMVLDRVFAEQFGPGLPVRPGTLERAAPLIWRIKGVYGERSSAENPPPTTESPALG